MWGCLWREQTHTLSVTPHLCLMLKMLWIQPEKDIIVQFIKKEDFKYI